VGRDPAAQADRARGDHRPAPEATVRPRRFLGPRRILQLSLLVAAVIALILAATGVLSPAFA
jgi:hypothetical protein